MEMLDELCSMDSKDNVVINHAATISLIQLSMLLPGYPTDIPAQRTQSHGVIKETVTVSNYLTVFMVWDDNVSSLDCEQMRCDCRLWQPAITTHWHKGLYIGC